jgi:hypothetical protein
VKSLKLAPALSLPLDAVSRTFGILAVRGAGKSNTAAVMAEEMFAAGLPFVVIDPVGSWYGLRSSADGMAAGLPIPIFGGKHGDVPLERGAGELLADLVVDKRLTCVLDLSRFDSEADKKHFLLVFARRLYQRNENPLHLFLEEADDYIPQSPMGDEKLLLRAWENIVRRGRARGLGMTLITQRSAAVAKMVLTQVETLFAMRTTGPQDIAAIEAWVKYHQVGKDVLSTLASLEDGEAWVWSPHFLKTMARHQIRRRATFDSGATPKNVRAKDTRPPATLADIDLTALQERMAATIEKAKADDPRELRKQLAEKAKRISELEKATSCFATSNERPKHEVRPVLTDLDRGRLEQLGQNIMAAAALMNEDLKLANMRLRSELEHVAGEYVARVTAVTEKAQRALAGELEKVSVQKILGKLAVVEPSPNYSKNIPQTTPKSAGPRVPANLVYEGGARDRARPAAEGLGKGERIVLTAVAQHPGGVTREQLTVLTGYARSSRDTYLQRLGQAGYVSPVGAFIKATALGIEALGDFEPLPTGDALRAYWLRELPEGERRVLQVLVDAYPLAVERTAIDAVTQYARSSRDTYLQRLGARRLIVSERGTVRASEELFG